MTFTGLIMIASGFLLVTLAIVPEVTRMVRSQPPGTRWLAALAKRTPIYYGWVVFAIASSTSYAARPVMSAATLSVFVVPMTSHFGWSRGLFAGAFSLGGLCAVAIMPFAGRLIDRYGSGTVIAVGSAIAGCSAMALALVGQVWAFYLVYVPGPDSIFQLAGVGTLYGSEQLVHSPTPCVAGLVEHQSRDRLGHHAVGSPMDYRRLELANGLALSWVVYLGYRNRSSITVHGPEAETWDYRPTRP